MPYKRNGKWIAQARVLGKTRRKLFLKKKQAIEWEVEQRKKLAEKKELETPTTCLLDWANSYLEFSEAKYVTSTYKEKRFVFRKLFKVINPNLPAEQLTPGTILAYLQQQFKTRSGYAANKDRKNLVAAWNWGIKYMGLPSPNPCLVERFPEIRQKRYVPPEKDFWKVYEMAECGQDKVMLLAYLHLAARRNELFQLRWEDVDFGEVKVRLHTRKRQDGSLEYDWLPLTDELYNALLLQKQVCCSEWVFPNPKTQIAYFERNKWMPRLCKKAGVKNFGLHSIRHLTASILAGANVSVVDIQAILRHRKLATTARYIKRLNSLRPALKILPSGKMVAQKSHQNEPPKEKRVSVSLGNPWY